MSLDELIDQLCDFRDSFGGQIAVRTRTQNQCAHCEQCYDDLSPVEDTCVRSDESRYVEISSS